MTNICRHCDETIAGKAYRVTSEEDGVPLLNMIVCASCAAVAKSLLLNTEEITPEYRTPSAAVSDESDLVAARAQIAAVLCRRTFHQT